MSPTTTQSAIPHIHGTSGTIRRHLRFSCGAEVDVNAVPTGRHLAASASELSALGCYIDTPEGFDPGTEVRLCLHCADGPCELSGKVIYLHRGWGMGVRFKQAAPEQMEALDRWLAELDQQTISRSAAV
jgi:hypothetical protein